MHIWVDADACPNPIKEILYRVAVRVSVPLTLVANQALYPPRSQWIRAVQVPAGFDVADNHIVQAVSAGDLVVTADIPLAAEVIERGALVVSPRGEELTASNIRPRLNMRDFLDQMRSSGEVTGGPPPLSNADRGAFANAVDRIVTKRMRADGG
ncbi:MAG: YaiI/YqxD family protein [Pseudomonadota bacterium]|nr:YaiI/YqxD family protein [Pseudomonadota bacterium]